MPHLQLVAATPDVCLDQVASNRNRSPGLMDAVASAMRACQGAVLRQVRVTCSQGACVPVVVRIVRIALLSVPACWYSR